MTGAPGVARAWRRRKFSDLYRNTHVYAWRRVFKASRNFRRELLASLRSFFSKKRPPAFPFECHMCGHQVESVDDRIEWHGLGNCVEICDGCLGTGLDETQPDPEAANLKCPECNGVGWYPMMPTESRPVLRFPARPIVPIKDAHFED